MATLRETIPLRLRKIGKKSIGSLILSMLLAGLCSLFVFGPGIAIIWMCLTIIFVSPILLYQYVYYRRYFYDSDEARLTIRKGVLAQTEATLPYSRITDVYVDQDLLDVLFGLYDVHISTPTEQSGRFAHIDGVNRRGATELKKLILEKIDENAQPTEGERPRHK